MSQGPPKLTPQQKEALQDIQNAYGIPVTRTIFRHIVKNSTANNTTKAELYNLIDQIHPEFDVPGGIDLVDINKKKWFIYLDDCSRDHNFTEQMEKMKLNKTGFDQVNVHLAIMFAYTRMKYADIINEFPDLVNRLHELYDHQLDIETLHADNNMFCVNTEWLDRIGFFVKEVK